MSARLWSKIDFTGDCWIWTAVTQAVNNRRGARVPILRARALQITACLRGHPYDPESTYRDKRGYRRCMTCKAQALRESRARARKAAEKGDVA